MKKYSSIKSVFATLCNRALSHWFSHFAGVQMNFSSWWFNISIRMPAASLFMICMKCGVKRKMEKLWQVSVSVIAFSVGMNLFIWCNTYSGDSQGYLKVSTANQTKAKRLSWKAKQGHIHYHFYDISCNNSVFFFSLKLFSSSFSSLN